MVSAVCGVAGKTGVGLIQIVGRQMQAVLLLQVLLPLNLLLFLHRGKEPAALQHMRKKRKRKVYAFRRS